MEHKHNMHSPKLGQSFWSPEDTFMNRPNKNETGMITTPNISIWPKSLEDSQVSSKQDSGYCSLTPRSGDSAIGIFGSICHKCNRMSYHSFAQSTPGLTLCNCKKSSTENQSPLTECMQTIPETKVSSTPKFVSRIKHNAVLFDEAMEASLYLEEMEVEEEPVSEENHQFSPDLIELGEEKSIDLVEPGVFSSSQVLVKEGTSHADLKTSFSPNTFTNSFDSPVNKMTVTEEDKLPDSALEEYFTPEVFRCKEVSPRLKNEVTPTKVKSEFCPLKMKKRISFRKASEKVITVSRVLRNFSLTGIEKIDFFYQLTVKNNCPNVVSKIFTFLSEKDLNSVRIVSKTWNETLLQDVTACNRWKLYNSTLRMMKENLASPTKPSSSGGRSAPFSQIHNVIINQGSPTQQRSPPVSPGSVRFHSFQKAARVLENGQRVLPCPKCFFASTDRGCPVVQCPRSGCRHRFCVWCRNEIVSESSHMCPPLYTPRPIRRSPYSVPPIGSKRSKRNLRRL